MGVNSPTMLPEKRPLSLLCRAWLRLRRIYLRGQLKDLREEIDDMELALPVWRAEKAWLQDEIKRLNKELA